MNRPRIFLPCSVLAFGTFCRLGLALEKWQRAGLWVMTRSDEDYPFRLKSRLKYDAPPVLFGCGNRQLLDRGGIAVVGSRDATEGDLGCASMLGGEMASRWLARVMRQKVILAARPCLAERSHYKVIRLCPVAPVV